MSHSPVNICRHCEFESYSVCYLLCWLCQDTEPPYQDVLESRFLTDAEHACCFEVDKHRYELNFVKMTQMNVETEKKREVTRRPCFISELDLRTGGLYVLLFCFCVNVYVEVGRVANFAGYRIRVPGRYYPARSGPDPGT